MKWRSKYWTSAAVTDRMKSRDHSTPWAKIITRPGSMIIASAMWTFSQAITTTACLPTHNTASTFNTACLIMHSGRTVYISKVTSNYSSSTKNPTIFNDSSNEHVILHKMTVNVEPPPYWFKNMPRKLQLMELSQQQYRLR